MRDEKNIEEARKEGNALFLDVCESFRYGVMSYGERGWHSMRVSGPARDPEDRRQLAEVPALFGADHNANGWHRSHDSEAPVVSSMRTPSNDTTLTLNQAGRSNT